MENTNELRNYDIDQIYTKLKDIPKMTYDKKVATILSLLKVPVLSIRSTVLNMASAVLSNETLISMLRDEEDDVIRNTAIEIIKNKGEDGFHLALELLKDKDKDVVLSAVLILDHFRDKRSIEPLTNLLRNLDDPNIIQASLIALGNTGDIRVLDTLLKFLHSDIWLQIASITALGELKNPITIKYLKKFLNDALLGSFALEALSKINSMRSFNIIFNYWLDNKESLDNQHILGHLCNIAENGKIKLKGHYFNELKKIIHSDSVGLDIKNLAVRIALATGISEDIQTLLDVLLITTDDNIFPICLLNRVDIVSELLAINTLTSVRWAIIICNKNIKKLNDSLVTRIIKSVEILIEKEEFDEQLINLLVEFFYKYKSNNILEDLFDLYLKIPLIERMIFNKILLKYDKALREIIKKKHIVDKKTATILDIILGNINENTLRDFFSLQLHKIKAVITNIPFSKKILDKFSFDNLMEKDKEEIIHFLVAISDKLKTKRYLPLIREYINKYEDPDIIKFLGEIKDVSSVKRLIELTDSNNPLIKSLAIESLGKICNEEGKRKLVSIATTSDTKIARIAYMALKNCAEMSDINFFRDALFNEDWYIRYIAIDALVKINDPDLDKYLFILTADPNKSVSDKAKRILEKRK